MTTTAPIAPANDVTPPPPATPPKPVETVQFDNINRAKLVRVTNDAKGDEILQALGLTTQPKALITISGGAQLLDQKTTLDEHLDKRLTQLFSRGIARTAADIGAALIDGGANSGVMAMMGQGVADRGYKSPLIGVLPAPLVRYPGSADIPPQLQAQAADLEPNHSHFVLVNTPQWGGETNVMYHLAEAIAPSIPALTVLVNGGDLACEEVLRSVRLGWPVIVVSGSGRLADEISQLYQEQTDFIPDPRLAEIINDGHIFLLPVDARVEELERMIRRLLRGDSTLRLAWERFAIYDANANRHQNSFKSIQFNILLLGVLGTFLALLQASMNEMLFLVKADSAWELALDSTVLPRWWMNFVRWIFLRTGFIIEQFTNLLRYVIIVIPIIATAMLAAANRFNAGSKWLLLRGTAEGVKREIFRYRAKAEIYNQQNTHPPKKSREARLAQELQNMSSRLMQTEVNISALMNHDGPIPPQYSTAPGDDGFTHLSPEQYLSYRIEDQYKYYRSKTQKLEKQLKRLQWLIYIVGGIGTLLAALGLELWIALTGSLVTALGTYLEYQQIEKTLLTYNQAATDLANVRGWWIALASAEQEEQSNIDMLVQQTERILYGEFSGWMQDMQDAFDALRKEQEKALKNSEQQGIDVGNPHLQKDNNPALTHSAETATPSLEHSSVLPDAKPS